jgi:hypothetical protein
MPDKRDVYYSPNERAIEMITPALPRPTAADHELVALWRRTHMAWLSQEKAEALAAFFAKAREEGRQAVYNEALNAKPERPDHPGTA